MTTEQQRYEFMLERDGEEQALEFAAQVHSSYRSAVLRSRKRGFPNPHHASLKEYRRGFIESYVFYKTLLFQKKLLTSS